VNCWPGRPEGHSPAEIVNECGSLAWQALGARSSGDHGSLRGGSLGESLPGGPEEQAQGSEIPWLVEQWLHGPMGVGLGMQHQLFF
jgi:hypothetical protein